MRVFCPNCSEPINIADDLAGKTTNCPLCKAAFTAPPLFSSTAAQPLPMQAPPASNSPASPVVANTPSPVSATPSPPAPLPPLPPLPQRDGDGSDRRPAEPSSARSIGLAVPPEIIQWVAPVCLGLVVFLALFFSWNGAYPGGHGVYTQGAFKALFGTINIDRVGEKVFNLNPAKPAEGQTRLEDDVHSNWLMLLYLPLLFGAFALAVFFVLLPQLPVKVPPNLQPMLPWRPLIVAGLALLLTLLLIIQASSGFGLERALTNRASAEAVKALPSTISTEPSQRSDEDEKYVEILEGKYRGMYSVRQTTALHLVFLLQFLAVVGAALTFVMNRRGERPLPRFEFSW